MVIDRKKSKKMRKAVIFAIVLGLVSIGNGIKASSALTENLEDNYLSKHFKMQQKQIEYLRELNEIDESMFDQNLMLIYDDGVLKMSGREYDINDLYIVTDKASGINYLVSYKEPKIDILSSLEIPGIEERQIFLFKNSSVFYDLYKLSDISTSNSKPTMDLTDIGLQQIITTISTYSGELQYQVPETYCLDKIKKQNK